MRRTLIMTVASTIVLAVTPGAALAQHHRGKHHRGHHHARTERFGTPMSGSGSTSASGDNAGTVSSFAGGMLTLKLSDGSTVSGAVNNDTEMECQAAQSKEMARDDGGQGSDNSGGDSGDSSGENQTAGQNDNQATEDQNEANENEANEDQNQANEDQNQANEDQNQANQDQNQANQNENGQACDSSALKPGTVVREAELRTSSGSATWKKVELEK